MNKSKFLLAAILLFSFILLFPTPVRAADLNIDCPAPPTNCTNEGTDPLFNITNDGFWYPGRTLTKTINLKNSSLEKREMVIKGERTSLEDILEDVMQISIVGGTTVIWSGSVADFYNQEKVDMGTFDSGADFDYDFIVSMLIEANNDYQNRETVFDLTLGFWGEPVPIPTATPTPASGGGDDGAGTVLGTGVSAPVCTDPKPGQPSNFTASVGPGDGQVTLSWMSPALPYTYFLIAYSDSSDEPPKWGNPNVGNVTSYIVSGLSSGTYWFWLRAGNGCMPGDFIGPISPGAITGLLGAGPVASGFIPSVLGEKTPGELGGGIATEEGSSQVAGIKTKSFNFWWLFLLLVFPTGFYFYFKRK